MQKPSSTTSLKQLNINLLSADNCAAHTESCKALLTPCSIKSLQQSPSNAKHSRPIEEYYISSQRPKKEKTKNHLNKKHSTFQKKPRDLCRSGYSFKTLDSVLSESQQEKKAVSRTDFRQHKIDRLLVNPFDCSELESADSRQPKETGMHLMHHHRKFVPQKTVENFASSPVSSLKKQASLLVNNNPAQLATSPTKINPSGKKLSKKPRKRLLPSQPTDSNPSESPKTEACCTEELFQLDLNHFEEAKGVAENRLKSDNRLPSFTEGSEDEVVGNAPSSKVSNSQSTEISPPYHQPNRSSVSWKNFDTFRQGIEAADVGQSHHARQQTFQLDAEPVPPSVWKSDGGPSDAPGPRGLFDLFH